MKLVIFDIDETLVSLLDVHRKAFSKTMKDVFDVDASLDEIDFPGHTIQQNLEELAELKKVDKTEIKSKIKQANKEYDKNFISFIPKDARSSILPGVQELLKYLREEKYTLGVVTGDRRAIAEAILEHTGLAKSFKFLVTSDNFKTRKEMVKHAIELAGNVDKVIVIGDSIHDIESVKGLGKSIAVETGYHTKQKLLKHKPDYCIKDLRYARKIFENGV